MSDTNNNSDKSEAAKKEEEILDFWEENNIFDKTLRKDSPEGEFVFYEGPPTANGHPGIHHLESRVFKDAIPRFKTMQGYHVSRKGGWDTHGLPVELEVEKDLGIETKDEIEEYGVGEFNEKCKESVWEYIEEWEAFTERMGYWLDLDDPYVTYNPNFMESVWNRFAQADKRDLLYKDYKVVPWCPRCETALSSHELAQGYETVKDLAVTAKFKLADAPEEITGGADTYVLAWTTTPWTLPANLALAVGEDITYVSIETEGGRLIVAKDRLEEIVEESGKEYEIIEEFAGDKLVGLSYEPLYPYAKELLEDEDFSDTRENAFEIYEADFVTTDEGTGIVHTAVMYGQDDFALGEDVGLPRLHLVDQTGHFKEGTDFLAGRFVHDEEVAVDIIKDLYHRDTGAETGLLFDKGKFEHEYPHCWRCDTPLVYYARNSWYIRMTELREDLLEENEKINWEPEHIKDGRFGEWLDGVQDWAVSRERFWGTPLPIWESEEASTDSQQADRVVIGSLEELKEKTRSTNTFFIMRHGEAESNVENIMSSSLDDENHMTQKGEKQVTEAVSELEKRGIDVVYVSPFMRTQETADLIEEELGDVEVVTDDRLGEVDAGDFDGKPLAEFHSQFADTDELLEKKSAGGESLLDVRRRMGDFLYEVDDELEDKNALIVSHSGPLWMLSAAAEGADRSDTKKMYEDRNHFINTGEVRELDFAPVPHDENYELDFHRPYVDDITWENENGQTMRRVPEVMDVWFDSGSVPYAQHHYPFENKEYVEDKGYPADFIAEAIDQTRGWFYTLHAIGVFSGKGRAYKNVISLGHILDENGDKMSKSRGNTVDPWEAMDKHGADAIRFWMYSINQPGESKNFSEDTVEEITKKVFNLIRNVTRFYTMYGGEGVAKGDLRDPYDSPHAIDQWILLRLNRLVEKSTEHMEDFDLLTPTRAIRDFVGDLSRWYIRRSRDRFKDSGSDDQAWALSTTQHVLDTLMRLTAPFTPFLAEEIYQKVSVDDTESVHLSDWPTSNREQVNAEDGLISDMQAVREVASEARDKRSQEHLKVRQPLATLKTSKTEIKDKQQLIDLLKDEVNVKEVVFDEQADTLAELDTEITQTLAREGTVRELIRQIQRLRKKADLDPENAVAITVETDENGKELVEEYSETITSTATLKEIDFSEVADGEEVDVHDFHFLVSLE